MPLVKRALHLTLLTRAYCHLCDEMLAAVRPLAAARGVPIDVIDVDADATLERIFGERVPALFAGDPATGVLLCQYRLDPVRVEAVLAGFGDARE